MHVSLMGLDPSTADKKNGAKISLNNLELGRLTSALPLRIRDHDPSKA
jgi:hypothetical protein